MGAASRAGAATATTTTVTLTPIADAYVDSSAPTTKYGSSTSLRIDGSPTVRSYLRFSLGNVSGQVTKATLLIWAKSSQSTGYDAFALADPTASWSESTISYSIAPALDATKVGSSGPVATNTWTSADVTPLASSGHTLNLAVATTNITALALASRESGATSPQLVVETSNSNDTEAPSTPTGLAANPASPTRIDLSWNASTDDVGVNGYDVYRDGQTTPLATLPGSTLSFSDTPVASGATHSYTVDAFDAAGNHSPASGSVSATTPDAPGCETSSPGSNAYSVTVCITSPAGGGLVTGMTAASATVSVNSRNGATPPGIKWLVFTLDGGYVLTDFTQPFSFTLPTARWVDGPHALQAQATMDDGFISDPTGINLSFSNGVTQPPVNSKTFTATSGTQPGLGQPFVLAAIGDGASGEPAETSVVNQIAAWNPNLFLYLGDVYEKGSPTEFVNYYDSGGTLYGRFRAISNPTIGNHEYSFDAQASGYFDYWDNVPHYYSFNAAGWHFISLDSTSQYGQTSPGTAQYEWLQQDLAADNAACTLVYYHHPLYNVGPEGPTTRMSGIWSMLVQHGGVLVLNGHDHDYQRYVPLDSAGVPNVNGVTEIVAGSGGHGVQQGVTSDPRLAASNFTQFGALRLQLNPTGANYSYITTTGTTVDSGAVPCNGPPVDTTPPSAPSSLSANAPSSDRVTLTWTASTDDVGVTGYAVYRDGSLLANVGVQTTYADTTVSASTTYSYTVKARDAAGNFSAASNAAGVTTPGIPSVSLFTDGFEGGNLSHWSTNNGLVVQQAKVYAGLFAGRATTTGVATWAYKQLSPAQSDLYYRLRFHVISQGANSVYLLKLRTATGTSILGVYRSSSGVISIRNDAGDLTTNSSTAASLGAWHTLELHAKINGVSSLTEVWLDGTKITALSKTQDLGTSAIGRIQLGDNSGSRTYDVALDDIAVDTSFIGS